MQNVICIARCPSVRACVRVCDKSFQTYMSDKAFSVCGGGGGVHICES